MPAERLTHPRIGHSRKVVSLTDTEFRVWDTYKWCADDFGVMPKAATKLQGENEALERHPREVIDAALERLLALELVVEFEHQGTKYICSLNWQTHQKVKYPRSTFHPCPPPEVIERMDDATLGLFKNFHEKFPKNPKGGGGNSAPRARARARNALALANAKASAEAEAGKEREETPRATVAVDTVLLHYAHGFEEATGQAPHIDQAKDRAIVTELVDAHGTEPVRRALSAMFTGGDEFVERVGYPLSLFRKQFNAFASLAAKQARSGCGHVPPCQTIPEHTQRIIEDARMERGASSVSH